MVLILQNVEVAANYPVNLLRQKLQSRHDNKNMLPSEVVSPELKVEQDWETKASSLLRPMQTNDHLVLRSHSIRLPPIKEERLDYTDRTDADSTESDALSFEVVHVDITKDFVEKDEAEAREEEEEDIADQESSRIELLTDLLSSQELHRNRAVLIRLSKELKRYAVRGGTHTHETAQFEYAIAHGIVYGGDPILEKLRNALVLFYSDDGLVGKMPKMQSMRRLSSGSLSSSLRSSLSSVDSLASLGSGLPGKDFGVLHTEALDIVAAALEVVIASDDEILEDTELNFRDSFWRRTIDSLVQNVEWCDAMEATGLSLKIVRLLHTLEPTTVSPLLRYTLLPHLSHLRDYGRTQDCPIIESEAARLLDRSEVVRRSLVEI